MAATTASAIRPGLRDNRQLSGSPHTPTSRFISSNYSSPGSTFRQEEDAVIIELDPRYLKAGFEGESAPQCLISFTPENARRIGDYRQWLPGYKSRRASLEDSVSDYELWRDDLGHDLEGGGFDVGLLEDKLERAVREAFNTHLLTDAGTARLVLVLPSMLPHPILSATLNLLFGRWKFPSIALVPRSTVCLAAAGLRSGMVVDIGWQDTTITSIYEYRELKTSRSIRGMKTLTMQIGRTLESVADGQAVPEGQSLQTCLPFIEDFIQRVACCSDEATTPTNEPSATSRNEQPSIDIDWPTETSSIEVSIPSSTITAIVDQCFLPDDPDTLPDDEELPLGQLLYNSLLQLPPDVRAICMSRIVFVGAGASIPGLRKNIISSLESIISRHGWTPIRGTHVSKQRRPFTLVAQHVPTPADAHYNIATPIVKDDHVGEKVEKQRNKESANPSSATAQPVQGQIRVLDSLGAWAGASLLTSLKIKGVVEIERNKFLEHGFAGASRELEVSVVPSTSASAGPQRMSSGPVAATAARGGQRGGWTLGGWA